MNDLAPYLALQRNQALDALAQVMAERDKLAARIAELEKQVGELPTSQLS